MNGIIKRISNFQIETPDGFVDKFLEIKKEIRDDGKKIQPLVSEIQKALLSLSEYARNLEPEELRTCLLSAIANGMSEPMKIGLNKQVDKLPLMIKLGVNQFLKTGTIPFSNQKFHKILSI
jgi:hypothetical protein